MMALGGLGLDFKAGFSYWISPLASGVLGCFDTAGSGCYCFWIAGGRFVFCLSAMLFSHFFTSGSSRGAVTCHLLVVLQPLNY